MLASDFAHLHVHSSYSLLDGISSPKKIVARAVELEQTAIALTDHGAMYGILDFYQTAREAKIKPILGCEVYVAPRGHKNKTPASDRHSYHLVLLARNDEGYANLMGLVTKAHIDGFYYHPRVDHDLLHEFGRGLVCMTACIGGEVPRAIIDGDMDTATKLVERYRSHFDDDAFFMEIQHHPDLEDQEKANNGVLEIAEHFGLPVVATNDSHYARIENAEAQDVLLCIQTNTTIDEKDRMSMMGGNYSMVATEDMESFFPANEEALTNTMRIAEMCNVEIDLGKARLPSFQTPRGQPPEEHLHELCELGLTHRYPIQKLDDGTWALAEGHSEDELPVSIPQILERLNFELGVINSMNFAEYFLIVWDFVNYAKKSDIIVGPGRGSAAGALVTYSLGITDLDPLAYDLLFERFLNPDRVSMPDADIDFDDEHRDEVIEYVRQKYGKDCVASIITFGTMRAKAAIKDVGRAMGLPYGERDQLAKLVPPRPGVELADCLEDEPEFKKAYDENDVNKKIIDLAIELEGVSRHTSVHPCAVVISDRPLENFVPLQHAPRSDDVVITEYGAKALEALGLLKMDFLGLRNLTVIRKTIKLIQKDHGVDIDIYNLPMDDAITYELLCKGETTAVFQLESAGMKRYLRQLRPNRFEDIIAMVALYRPGPMQFIEEYCERKHGRKSVQYDHPSMEAALKNTHGITVYQEQVMQMSRDLAGFTRGEADFLRVAMGKKIVSMMEELKDKFMVGATGHGIDEKLANKIWADWEKFASYAFNKSHAACYAFVAYQTAYLKAHYPREFMAASLTSEMDKSDRIIVLIDECRRMGEQIRPPDVNESNLEFSVEPEGIRFGLLAVRNLGAQAIEAMLEARDEGGRFTSLFDFCRRVDLKAINKRMVESLTKAGAMDAFGDRGQLLQGADMAVGWGQDEQDNASRGQTSLFEAAAKEGDSGPSAIPELPKVPPLSGPERLAQERELLGFYISGHPLDAHRRDIELFCSHASDALPETSGGTPLLTAGVIMSIRRITTKKGKSMAVLICEDFAGSYEAVVFPDALKEADRHLIVDNAVMIRGARDDDEPKVLVDQLIPMADARQILAKALDVTVATSRLTEEGIAELQRIVSINGGSLPVYLHVATKAHGTFAFQVSGGRINPTDDFLALVESHPATEAVKLRAAPLVAREPRRRPSQRDGYPQRGQ